MSDKKYNILVVPAGSRIATGIIKFLSKEKNFNIISADIDKLAPGLYLSHKAYKISPFSQENFFWQDLKKIIKKEKIDIMIPALDPLLVKFVKNKIFFDKLNVRLLISPLETILLTNDKWLLYQKLKDCVAMPISFIDKKKINISFPLFIKPREGSGSIGALKINNKKELDFYFRKNKKLIIQEYLEGKEYTVDCLADINGRLLTCIPRIRLDTKAGVSIKGKIVKNSKIEKMAKKISQKIKFKGPFLLQLKEKKGAPKLIEINARFGGGMPFSSLMGPNIYFLSVKLFLDQKINQLPKIKYGAYFTRYDEEIYLNDKSINSKVKRIK